MTDGRTQYRSNYLVKSLPFDTLGGIGQCIATQHVWKIELSDTEITGLSSSAMSESSTNGYKCNAEWCNGTHSNMHKLHTPHNTISFHLQYSKQFSNSFPDNIALPNLNPPSQIHIHNILWIIFLLDDVFQSPPHGSIVMPSSEASWPSATTFDLIKAALRWIASWENLSIVGSVQIYNKSRGRSIWEWVGDRRKHWCCVTRSKEGTAQQHKW